MTLQPTLDKLSLMHLGGMRDAIEEQLTRHEYAELPFEDRLTLLVDREWSRREDNRLQSRLKAAHFRQRATITDLDIKPSRGLDRATVLALAQCEWVRRGLNVVIVGPTGAGKSFLACALGNAACREGFAVRFERMPHLLHRLALSHADGSWEKLLRQLARVPLLVIDDWLRDPLGAREARDIVDLLDDRYPERPTLVASQLPIADWHAQFPDPTLAEAVLDRLIHNAHRLELKGDSQRRARSPLTNPSS